MPSQKSKPFSLKLSSRPLTVHQVAEKYRVSSENVSRILSMKPSKLKPFRKRLAAKQIGRAHV